MKYVLVIFIFVFGLLSVNAQARLSANAEVVRVNRGQAVTVRKEIYFNTNGRMVVKYLHPEVYYMVTNALGEARIYHPRTNEVMVINDRFLSSEGELIYFFLTNRIEDLGLRSLGFLLTATRTEENKIIRTFSPNEPNVNISKIELVHENHLPIYSAYYDARNRVTQRIYYSDYQMLPFAAIPQRVTQIEYVAPNDSVVSRLLYNNVKTGREAVSQYFDFVVPSDAKIVDSDLLMRPAGN